MSRVRRLGVVVALVLLPALGCGDGSGSAPADTNPAPAEAPPPDVGIVPDASGGRVRGKAGDPPPEEPPEPDQIVLPKDGGSWPWNLASASEPRSYRPVVIDDVTSGRLTGMAVRPELDRAVVTINIPWKKPGEPELTRVVLCDTAAGRVLAEWKLSGPWVPLDISPDGRNILARGNGYHAKASTLAVWTVTDDNGLKRRSCQPHESTGAGLGGALVAGNQNPNDHTCDIAWGAWVGDRILTSSKAGQFLVLDAQNFKRVGGINAAPGRPALTPDGTKAAFRAANGVVLIDPATCKVIGTKRTGNSPEPAALAFSPDGKRLAIASHEQVTFLDLDRGDVWDVNYPKSDQTYREVPDSFGWAGNRHLFARDSLYELGYPTAVWRYHNVDEARCIGRQTWVVVRPIADKSATLRPFELPHPGVEAKVAAEPVKPGLFVLKPGDGVAVDVSAIPGPRQAEVLSNLSRHLQEVGYRYDPQGSARLVASIDPPRQTTVSYIGHKPIAYTETPARLRLVKDGKVLWEQARAVSPPFSVQLANRQALSAYIHDNGYGAPRYEFFATAPIPKMFRGPKAPIAAFGISELSATGIRDRR